MKTVKQIEKEIVRAKTELSANLSVLKTRDFNRIQKEIEGYELCELYLRTAPSESFVLSEAERLEKRLSLIDEQYIPPPNHKMMQRKELTKAKKEYEKEYQVPKLKSQLKFLRFILD